MEEQSRETAETKTVLNRDLTGGNSTYCKKMLLDNLDGCTNIVVNMGVI
jgi:hypothetical protein